MTNEEILDAIGNMSVFELADMIEAFKEKLRGIFARELPDVRFSFEPQDIVSRVMSFGSPTPIEIAISGSSLPVSKAYADKIIEQVRLPIPYGAQMLEVGASIGISQYPRDGHLATELIAAADRAMYRAKGDGRNRVRVDGA